MRRLSRLDGLQRRRRVRRRKHQALHRGPAPVPVGPAERGSMGFVDWAYARGVALDFTRPGKPTDNGHIESSNGRLRDEFLNVHQFASLADVRARLEAWRVDYHEHRPHSSLGHLTPREDARRRHPTPAAEAA